jgi:DNA-binding CsgD family transcriptional regulator
MFHQILPNASLDAEIFFMTAERSFAEPTPPDLAVRASRRSSETLVILDSKCRVLLVTADATSVSNGPGGLLDDRGHLRDDLREVAAELIARCERLSEDSVIAFIDSARFARIVVLDGHLGRSYVFTIEQYRERDSLARAARRFSLTTREVQVLALILEGTSASEVAAALHIAETTVQGYYKRLLQKTQSRNRPSMVATVCDWEGARTQRDRREDAR